MPPLVRPPGPRSLDRVTTWSPTPAMCWSLRPMTRSVRAAFSLRRMLWMAEFSSRTSLVVEARTMLLRPASRSAMWSATRWVFSSARVPSWTHPRRA